MACGVAAARVGRRRFSWRWSQVIRDSYLGVKREKKKIVKPSEKFAKIFQFEWELHDDTSKDLNPLCVSRRVVLRRVVFRCVVLCGRPACMRRLCARARACLSSPDVFCSLRHDLRDCTDVA